eukprot:7096840-Prymnesium_polylepis.1
MALTTGVETMWPKVYGSKGECDRRLNTLSAFVSAKCVLLAVRNRCGTGFCKNRHTSERQIRVDPHRCTM